jgi:hypothetical protein
MCQNKATRVQTVRIPTPTAAINKTERKMYVHTHSTLSVRQSAKVYVCKTRREEENLCWPAQYEWHRVMATLVWLVQYWHPRLQYNKKYTRSCYKYVTCI